MLALSTWRQKVFGYCERGEDPAFWAEPLNAWSNGAFWIAAAVFAIHLVTKRSAASSPIGHLQVRAHRDLWILNVLLVGIGAGSFCFHTFAERWSGVMDVGFIVLWVWWYLWVSSRRVMRWQALLALGLLIAHMALSIALLILTRWFLMSYVPTAAMAYLLACHATRFPLPGRSWLWGSAVVFTVSMIMAGLDEPLCELVPTGTHFLWHMFNATALFLASVGLEKNLNVRQQRERGSSATGST